MHAHGPISPRPRRRGGPRALAAVVACAAWAPVQPAPPPPDIAPKLQVLDAFVGTWDVTVQTLRPQPAEIRYTEVYRWALDGHFLQGDTGVKSDGTQDHIVGAFDPASGGYPFWIFSSSGAWYYLAPGRWDAAERSFHWRNPPNTTVLYEIHTRFPDPHTRQWSLQVKDWKGSVVLEQKGAAVRRGR